MNSFRKTTYTKGIGGFMNFKRAKKLYNFRNFIVNLIQILVGSAMLAAGVSFFLLPNQLSSGGFSGVATILYYLMNLPMGTTIIVLNIPLFILAFFKIGKKFLFNSIIGTISLSFFIDMFDKFNALTTDRLLASIYGGIFIGIGTATILKAHSSTGGSDLLSQIIKKYNPKIRTGNLITIIDIVIVLLNVIFFKQIEIGLYSALAIYIMGKIIDIFFEGIYFTKMMIIISDKYEEISNKINEEVGRGTTAIYGRGMYRKIEKELLLCVASRGEIIEIRELIKKIDKNAFIIITNAREVFGKGFKEHS